jgi:TPR repeat protein
MTALESQLTRAQLAEGQKRAGDFKLLEVPSLDAQPGGTLGNLPADLFAKAESGDAQARNELGEAYYAGKRGVARNPVEAVKWFRKAAEQNHPVAQSNLGVCYERGDGVGKYEVESYKWYLLAAAQGDRKGKLNASTLEMMLSPEEISDGKRRAQAWLTQRQKAPTGERELKQ